MASGIPSSRRQISTTGPTRVRVHLEAGAHGGGPVGEQPHRREGQRLLGRRVRRRQAERGDRGQRLAGDRERLPAGGQDAQLRAAGQQLGRGAGGGLDQVLAVVQHDQRAPVGEQVDEQGQRVGLARLLPAQRVGQPDRAEHGLRDLRGVADRGQLGQPGAAGEPVQHPDRGLGGQPGLAGAAGADQRDQPVPVEQRGDRGQVVVPADEAGELGRHVGPAHRGPRLRGGPQHPQVDLLQRGGRVDAELVGQPPADVLVRGERVGLPAGRVERADLLAADALAQRVIPGQGLQLGQHLGVAAELQRGVDAVLGGGEPALGQPVGRGVRPGLAGGVGQRRAAPERERLGQQPAGAGGVAVQRAAAGLGQPLELGRVDQPRVDGQPVAGRARTRPARPAAPGAAGRPATAAR